MVWSLSAGAQPSWTQLCVPWGWGGEIWPFLGGVPLWGRVPRSEDFQSTIGRAPGPRRIIIFVRLPAPRGGALGSLARPEGRCRRRGWAEPNPTDVHMRWLEPFRPVRGLGK